MSKRAIFLREANRDLFKQQLGVSDKFIDGLKSLAKIQKLISEANDALFIHVTNKRIPNV